MRTNYYRGQKETIELHNIIKQRSKTINDTRTDITKLGRDALFEAFTGIGRGVTDIVDDQLLIDNLGDFGGLYKYTADQWDYAEIMWLHPTGIKAENQRKLAEIELEEENE